MVMRRIRPPVLAVQDEKYPKPVTLPLKSARSGTFLHVRMNINHLKAQKVILNLYNIPNSSEF